MIKKKFSLVFFIALFFIVVLGQFTSCYAVENVGQVKNMVYNILVNVSNFNDLSATTFIENNESYFTQISPYCNENYYMFAIRNTNTFYIMFEPVTNFRKSAYVSNLGWYCSYSKCLRLQNVNTTNPSLYYNQYGNQSERLGTNTTYIYTEHDIYANTSGSNANVVVYSARYNYAILVQYRW